MKALVEIERAVEELPAAQKTELLLFVAKSLCKEQAPLPEPPPFPTHNFVPGWMRTRRRCAASARTDSSFRRFSCIGGSAALSGLGDSVDR